MKHNLALPIAFFLLSALCPAQTPPSDPQALALIAKAIAAMTGGNPVSGVTLNASAIWIAGSDYFTGPATLQATGATESRLDLKLNGFTRTEIRTGAGSLPSGSWIDASGSSHPIALHNCWTDAVWFFPSLSSLSLAAAHTKLSFSYLGQGKHNGVSAQHIRVSQVAPPDDVQNLLNVPRVSTTDFYFDAASFFPIAIAFKVHPDKDMNTDIPMEIGFANYQPVSGVQVPFHIQRMLNGEVVLDLTVTSAVMNSGLVVSKLQ